MKKVHIRVRTTAHTHGNGIVHVRTTVSGPKGSKTVNKTYRFK